jgi:hypothetical protein
MGTYGLRFVATSQFSHVKCGLKWVYVRLSSLTCRMLVELKNVANKIYVANLGDGLGDVDFDSHRDQKIFLFF